MSTTDNPAHPLRPQPKESTDFADYRVRKTKEGRIVTHSKSVLVMRLRRQVGEPGFFRSPDAAAPRLVLHSPQATEERGATCQPTENRWVRGASQCQSHPTRMLLHRAHCAVARLPPDRAGRRVACSDPNTHAYSRYSQEESLRRVAHESTRMKVGSHASASSTRDTPDQKISRQDAKRDSPRREDSYGLV